MERARRVELRDLQLGRLLRAPCASCPALLVAILLTGCASAIPEKPIVQTVEVRIPVQVPCKVELPATPVFELDRTSPDASLFELARAAVIEIKQRRIYAKFLEAALAACVDGVASQ